MLTTGVPNLAVPNLAVLTAYYGYTTLRKAVAAGLGREYEHNPEMASLISDKFPQGEAEVTALHLVFLLY